VEKYQYHGDKGFIRRDGVVNKIKTQPDPKEEPLMKSCPKII